MRAEPADAAPREIARFGGKAFALRIDVADEHTAPEAVLAAAEAHGGLYALINNAGVDVTLPIDEISVEQWDAVLRTNLRGPFLLCRAAATLMKRQRRGHIVNVTSTAAKRAWPNASAYHATKWGLLGLSHALHAELRPQGVRVCAVVAGGICTPVFPDRLPHRLGHVGNRPDGHFRATFETQRVDPPRIGLTQAGGSFGCHPAHGQPESNQRRGSVSLQDLAGGH